MKKLITVKKHLRKGKTVKSHVRNCGTKKVRKYLKNFDSERDGEQSKQDKGHTKSEKWYDPERAKVQGVDMLKVTNHMRKRRAAGFKPSITEGYKGMSKEARIKKAQEAADRIKAKRKKRPESKADKKRRFKKSMEFMHKGY